MPKHRPNLTGSTRASLPDIRAPHLVLRVYGLCHSAYVQCHCALRWWGENNHVEQMLEEDDLGPADEALLDMLQEGRVTAPYAADETGYSLQYVRDRLGRLVEHGNAKKVYEGLYELVEDPRQE